MIITAFEVPPGADAAFRRSFDRPGTLFRALRDDVALRFVHVADDPAAAPSAPFPAHTATYDAAHEDGDVDGVGGALLITPFDVPPGADEEFLPGWEALRGLFAGRQGYLGSRLHRSTGPADYRFVALVRWSSPLMYARALRQPEVQRAGELPYPGLPALYLAT